MRFKIFHSQFAYNEDFADIKANKWLAEHPDIAIIDIRYQHCSGGFHSICIFYREEHQDETIVKFPPPRDTRQSYK